MMLYCKKIPVRIWIIVLIFTTRFLMMSIAQTMRFSKPHMVEYSHQIRYKPWCHLTTRQRLEEVRIPWKTRSPSQYGPKHKWKEEHLEHIKDAQFYGQMIASIPGGILAQYVGSYYVLLYTTSVVAILNTGRVVLIATEWGNLWILELVLGLHIGLVYPAIYNWIARWSPPNERGLFVASHVANGFGKIMTKIIVRSTIKQVGWQSAFYIFTILTILHLIPLWFLGSNNPEDHKRISAKELLYIKRSQRRRVTSTRSFPPFANILTSGAFWPMNILKFGTKTAHYFFIYEVADFLIGFMGIPERKVEIIEVFPHIAYCGVAISVALFGDYVRTNHMMDDTTIGRTCTLFSHLGPGLVLMFMGVSYCNGNIAVVLLFIGYAANGACIISCYRTIVDISPNYAGTVYGLSQVSASVVPVIVKKLRKAIFEFSSGIVGWTIIFLIGGGCLVATGILFLFFGTAETQRWNLKSQDIFKLYDYKQPEQRPSLEGENNFMGTSRIKSEPKKDLLDKGIDIDTEEWKSAKDKSASLNIGGTSQPKTVSSRKSESMEINDNVPVLETFKKRHELRTRFSRTNIKISSNTLPVVSGFFNSSDYSERWAELGQNRTIESVTTALPATHAESSQKLYGTMEKDNNYYYRLFWKRSKSSPDLRRLTSSVANIINKHEEITLLQLGLPNEEINSNP